MNLGEQPPHAPGGAKVRGEYGGREPPPRKNYIKGAGGRQPSQVELKLPLGSAFNFGQIYFPATPTSQASLRTRLARFHSISTLQPDSRCLVYITGGGSARSSPFEQVCKDGQLENAIICDICAYLGCALAGWRAYSRLRPTRIAFGSNRKAISSNVAHKQM